MISKVLPRGLVPKVPESATNSTCAVAGEAMAFVVMEKERFISLIGEYLALCIVERDNILELATVGDGGGVGAVGFNGGEDGC